MKDYLAVIQWSARLRPEYWPTLDEIDSFAEGTDSTFLRPDMSLLDWQSGEESVGMSLEVAERFYAVVPRSRRGQHWRQTESAEWTTGPKPKPPPKHTAWDSLINGLSRWSAKSRVRNTVRALSRTAAPRPLSPTSEAGPRVETHPVLKSAFVPLGRRHVFLDGDGSWRCMNGDAVESTGSGDYWKLLDMTIPQWFELLGNARTQA